MARPPRRRSRGSFVVLLAGVAGLLMLSGLYLCLLGGTVAGQRDAVGGAFELTSSNGTMVSDRTFRGHFQLIYFGYASCQDVCPTTLSAMAGALDSLGARAMRIQPLFITIDPTRDTPSVLRRYVANFSPRLIGLTGTSDQLRAVQHEFRISTIVHHGSRPLVADSIDHSSVLVLIGPDGHFIAPIRADLTGPELATELTRYLS
jgi:protein SCO1/2